MLPIVTVLEMMQYDQRMILHHGYSSMELIAHVGDALFAKWKSKFTMPSLEKIGIVVGSGNNGSDAMYLGIKLLESKENVFFYTLKNTDRNIENQQLIQKINNEFPNRIVWFDENMETKGIVQKLESCNIIVDGLFGIGLKRKIDGIYYKLVAAMNQIIVKKISIDIPSGLHGDYGIVYDIAVQANETWVIQGLKIGNCINQAKDYQGKVEIVKFRIDMDISSTVQLITNEDIMISKRKQDSHKYFYGRTFVIGGVLEMIGASWLSSMASLKSGSGSSSIIVTDRKTKLLRYNPEVMVFHRIPKLQMQKQNVVCIYGPGLGRKNRRGKKYLTWLLNNKIKLVVDADGLVDCKLHHRFNNNQEWIMTPHIKEFADFISLPIEQVRLNPIKHAIEASIKWNAVIVLKGSTTIIAYRGNVFLISEGTAALATAGSGDVLSGIIAARLANNQHVLQAAIEGVYIHAIAGKLAEKELGEDGVIASDILHYIPYALKKLKKET